MLIPEVGYRAPSAPDQYELHEREGIRIYISKRIRLHGPMLRIRAIRGWLGEKIEVQGIQLVPGGRR